MLKTTRPRFAEKEVAEILRDGYDVSAAGIHELPSERDQNFLITHGDERLVLKIANTSEPREIIDFQNQALAHVFQHAPDLPVPRIRKSLAGEPCLELKDGNLCRLLDYLDGTPLAVTRPLSDEVLRAVGGAMGRLDVALEEFSHEAQGRDLYWDSKHARSTIEQGIELIDDDVERSLVERILAQFRSDVEPRLAALPSGVIHNDGNDHNILVEGDQVTGLLDFGDMVSSCLVFEVANTAAYCMLMESDPMRVAAAVVAGYHANRPLSDEELEVLFPLIRVRLAMSLANCARQARDEPDKEYLSISAEGFRRLARALDPVSTRLAHYRFREACGLTPHPRAEAVGDWLADRRSSVLAMALEPSAVHMLDLSIGSTELGGLDVLEDVGTFTRHIFGTMDRAGAKVGVGRYGEARPLYTAPGFLPGPGEHFETRTVHLGVDLFVDAGTPIRAPLAGTIHSFQCNDLPLDYGPTIIIEHRLDNEDEDTVWTLYGHLSDSSIEGLTVGDTVERGQVIGTVGRYPGNGNWPPHLHFQLMLDMLGGAGDFPGVCKPSERELWLGLCPDPSALSGLPTSVRAPAPTPSDAIRDGRKDHLSSTLSLSYREPLHIVRGYGSFLYDEGARPYLDMVNNVCHVGHCHPHVVRAAQSQIAVLNTNTRYLHDNITRYAEKLVATLPEPLEVCFFVNSGSEANDLALRLARGATGRKDTIVLDGAYHGNLSSLIEVSPYKFDGRGGRGAPEHVHKLTMPDGYRGTHRAEDSDYGERYLDDARARLEELEAAGRAVGVLIAESILSCGGQVVLPPGYLKSLYALVREAGGVCIADEVQVGFGRVGSSFWAFEAEDAVPDIVTMGKPIGNGHPLAAVVTTREIATAFDTGMEYFNTFGGNPVSSAVGLAVLDVIEREQLQANALRVGARLTDGLSELQSDVELIGDVRGRGLFLGMELVESRDGREPAKHRATDLVNCLKAEGILASTDGPLENVIKLKPPIVLSDANADRFVDRLAHILSYDRFKI